MLQSISLEFINLRCKQRMFTVHWHLISPPKQMLDKVQWESRIRSALRLMSQLPLLAVKSNLMSLGVTSCWHMHVTAAQPIQCRIQTWQHLHLLRLSPHLTQYEVCVKFYKLLLTNVCNTPSSLSSLFPLPPSPPPAPTHILFLQNILPHHFLLSSLTFSLLSLRPGTACRTQEDKVVSNSSLCVLSLLWVWWWKPTRATATNDQVKLNRNTKQTLTTKNTGWL